MVWLFEIRRDWKDIITKYAWLHDLRLGEKTQLAIFGTTKKNLNMEWIDDIMKFLLTFLAAICKRMSLFLGDACWNTQQTGITISVTYFQMAQQKIHTHKYRNKANMGGGNVIKLRK